MSLIEESKNVDSDENEYEYEYLEEEEYCTEVIIDDVKYYKDRNGVLYDYNTHEEV